jgi:hypothetical protein
MSTVELHQQNTKRRTTRVEILYVGEYSFQCRIQLQNTVQNTNRRLFQRYSAQELVHIYLRRASGTRVLCTLVQNAPCKYIVLCKTCPFASQDMPLCFTRRAHYSSIISCFFDTLPRWQHYYFLSSYSLLA